MSKSDSVVKRPSIVAVHELDVCDLKFTSFCDTLTNLVKAYLGCGMLALGMAFKNGGLLFCLVTYTILGLIAGYNQHLLVKTSNYVRQTRNLQYISYGETIQVAFEEGPNVFKNSSDLVRSMIKLYIVLSQYGFCCAYFLFLSESLKQLCACYDVEVSIHLLMLYILPVILVVGLIRQLKYISPLSTLANLSTLTAISLILYESMTDLGSISDRKFIGKWDEIPLAFGTMIFSLEGINAILPFQQNMEKKEQFLGTFGVLTISLVFVTLIMQILGFFGYYKFGDDVKESLTLNLDVKNNVMAQGVILFMMLGILSSFALQFLILIVQFLPNIKKKTVNWPFYSYHLYEYILRLCIILLSFLMAQIVPHLDLVISLIGSVTGTTLSFLFVPLADISLRKKDEYGFLYWRIIVNIISIIISVLGCLLGTTFSLKEIIIVIEKNYISTI